MRLPIKLNKLTLSSECIPRDLMPQIDTVDIPGLRVFLLAHGLLVEYLADVGVGVVTMKQCVKDTRPATLTPSLRKKPLIISEDYELVDGNGRYLAYKAEGTVNCPALWVNTSFVNVVLLMGHYEKTYTLFGGKQPSRE